MRILLTGVTGNLSSCLVAVLFVGRGQTLVATRNPALQVSARPASVVLVISDTFDHALTRASFPLRQVPRAVYLDVFVFK
ncbi:hypothetical protein [Mycobacterium uberis]|uniref:hypothetical protein n=1 Tax=Mycobacterium uberis TaxID=2162698 RepID=UPI001058DDD9|nr:hypothetical protein [Mycobacterium uberis]